ncbi:hypothetical protein LEMLEM_LOCUS3262 [Lemmus lemmus]
MPRARAHILFLLLNALASADVFFRWWTGGLSCAGQNGEMVGVADRAVDQDSWVPGPHRVLSRSPQHSVTRGWVAAGAVNELGTGTASPLPWISQTGARGHE